MTILKSLEPYCEARIHNSINIVNMPALQFMIDIILLMHSNAIFKTASINVIFKFF